MCEREFMLMSVKDRPPTPHSDRSNRFVVDKRKFPPAIRAIQAAELESSGPKKWKRTASMKLTNLLARRKSRLPSSSKDRAKSIDTGELSANRRRNESMSWWNRMSVRKKGNRSQNKSSTDEESSSAFGALAVSNAAVISAATRPISPFPTCSPVTNSGLCSPPCPSPTAGLTNKSHSSRMEKIKAFSFRHRSLRRPNLNKTNQFSEYLDITSTPRSARAVNRRRFYS